MADGTVDNLNIQITAEAKSAEKSLDSLSATLLKVNRNLQSSVGTIRKVSKEVGTLKTAIDSISKIGNVDFNSSGIGKTMNSLKRLLGADMSKFNTEGFKNITDTIRQFGNMPDISNSVNRFVSSIARLASAGSKTKDTADNIKRLGEQTRLAAQELKGIGNISNDLNMFVQSIGRLASAGNKTGQTASNLRNLANETYEFFKVMSKAPHISENTIRMTQALAQLASAGGRVSTSTGKISTAFSKLASIGNKTLSAMKKIASGIASAFKQIGTSSKHVDTARFSLGSLLKTAIGFRLGYGLLQFGQQAFELGSAITEVENVVDVAFGSMADKAYEFASTATEQYGLSELAAKQYAGTMMAMLNSTGVAQDAAAEMSTTLAGLAGDLASFYNISTDEAFMKLRSAIAGETEPMRQLGVNMTVATLESYALSQGITKSWQSMTQAEQAMLRYNYLMSATAQQQGDYARTINSFANQWRLLTLNVQQFSATIGQGLIAAVLPAIQAINALFSVLMRAAEAFRNFMYVLTGYKGQGSQGGIVNEMAGIGDVSTGLEDIGTAGGDASSGMDDATDSAKDLKKALSVLSFDELNQLSSSAEDLGDALGGVGGGGGGLDDINVPGTELGGFDDMIDALGKSKLPEAVNEWAERLRAAFLDHDWDRLGEEIAWGINKGMQAIYDAIRWENVGPKITAFTSAFTQTLNSLVDHIDWDLMGKTVGAGVNTIVNTLNQLIEGFDFTNLGSKLSEGLRGTISEIQWTNLGNLLGNYFMIPWNMFSGFIAQMAQENNAGLTGFEQLGISLGNAFNGIFDKIDFGVIGTTLANGINGAFQVLRNFVATVEWDDLAVNIYTGLNNMINGIDWATAGATLSEFVTELLGTFVTVAQNTDWEGLGRSIGQFLSNIDWLTIFNQVITIIGEILGGLIEGLGETTIGKILLVIAGIAALFKIGTVATSVKESVNKVLSIWGYLPKGLNEKKPLISSTIDALKPLFSKIGTFAKNASSTVVTKIGEISKGIAGKIPAIGSAIGQVGSKLMTLVPKAASMVTGAVGKLGGLIAAIGPAGWIAIGIGAGIVAIIANWDKVKEAAGVVKDWIVEKWDAIKTKTSEIWEAITSFISEKWDSLIGWTSETFESIKATISETWDNVKTKTVEIWDSIIETLSGLPDKLLELGKKAIGGFLDGIVEVVSDIKGWIEENIFNPVVNGFKELFGINSPSTVFAELGGYLMEGLLGGIGDLVGDVTGIFDDIGTKIGETWDNIKTATSEAWEGIKSTAEGIWEKLKDGVSKIFGDAEDTVSESTAQMKEDAETNLSGVGDAAESAFGDVSDTTVTNWGNSAEEVKLNLRAMKLAASEQLAAMTETVRSYSKSMYNIFTEKFEDIAQQVEREISSMDSSVSGSMRNMLSGMQNDVRNYVSQIANEFSRLSNQIANNMQGMYNVGRNAAVQFANGISSVHIPMPHITVDSSTWNTGSGYSYRMNSSVQWYKKGGLFMQPSVIGLAEAGKEAVLPLENRRTMSMIADSIMGNATTGMNEETLTNAVTAGVTMALMNNQGNQTPINLYATLYTEDNEVLARAVAKGQESIDYRYNPTPQFG